PGQQRARRLAEHEYLARGDPNQVADRADQRGLAGPVRTEQAEEGALGDLQVEVAERGRAVVVALCEVADVEGRHEPEVRALAPLPQPPAVLARVIVQVLARAERRPPPLVVAVPVDGQ